jgi:hypothetical protein
VPVCRKAATRSPPSGASAAGAVQPDHPDDRRRNQDLPRTPEGRIWTTVSPLSFVLSPLSSVLCPSSLLPCHRPPSFVPRPSSLTPHPVSPYTSVHHVNVDLPYVRQRACASAPGFGVAGESCDMALEQGRPIWVDKPTLGAYHQFSLSAFVPKLARFWAPSWTHGKHYQSAFGESRREICDAGRNSG